MKKEVSQGLGLPKAFSFLDLFDKRCLCLRLRVTYVSLKP